MDPARIDVSYGACIHHPTGHNRDRDPRARGSLVEKSCRIVDPGSQNFAINFRIRFGSDANPQPLPETSTPGIMPFIGSVAAVAGRVCQYPISIQLKPHDSTQHRSRGGPAWAALVAPLHVFGSGRRVRCMPLAGLSGAQTRARRTPKARGLLQLARIPVLKRDLVCQGPHGRRTSLQRQAPHCVPTASFP